MVFTSRDVARVAGVSQSTVSYVMSGKRPISDTTRRRVMAAIEELTYQPNASARALASQRTRVIGLVVPLGAGADTHELLPFIESITEAARRRDHDVLLVTSREGPAALTRLAGRMLCDGMLVMDVETHDPRVPVAASLRVPVVLIGVPQEPLGLTCVDLDYAEAARLAVDELARTRHDRVFLLGGPAAALARDFSFVRSIEEGATRAAAAHGIRLEILSPVEPGHAGARGAAARVLAGRSGGARVGVIAWRARVLQPLLDALAARGARPGVDVSVVGLCADGVAVETEPLLTNVAAAPDEVSADAVRMLFRLLEKSGPRERGSVRLVAPRLTRRDTVVDGAADRD